MIDILSHLKEGDSCCQTLMPERENVPCRVDVAVMRGSTRTTGPFTTQSTDRNISNCTGFIHSCIIPYRAYILDLKNEALRA